MEFNKQRPGSIGARKRARSRAFPEHKNKSAAKPVPNNENKSTAKLEPQNRNGTGSKPGSQDKHGMILFAKTNWDEKRKQGRSQ
jgi:hypothetical protein